MSENPGYLRVDPQEEENEYTPRTSLEEHVWATTETHRAEEERRKRQVRANIASRANEYALSKLDTGSSMSDR